MGAYTRKKKRATQKRRRPEEETVTRKGRPVAKRPASKKTEVKKTVAKRLSATSKPEAKRRLVKRKPSKRKVTAASKPQKTKKPAIKKPAVKRPAVKRPAVKRPAVKRLAVKSRAVRRSEKLQKELEKLRAENEALRAKGKKTRKKAQAKVRKKTEQLIKQSLPKRATPKLPSIEGEAEQRFQELFEIAKRTGQLPKGDHRKRKIASKRNVGERRVVKVNDFVRDDTVEQILYDVRRRARSMTGIYANWQSLIAMSSFGSAIFGSGVTILVADEPDAALFQAQLWENTGVFTTFEGMLHALEHELLKLIDARTLVWCHFIEVRNYSARIVQPRGRRQRT